MPREERRDLKIPGGVRALGALIDDHLILEDMARETNLTSAFVCSQAASTPLIAGSLP